jgi:hypothetical protein
MKIVILLILIALAGFSVYSSNANAQNSNDRNLETNKGGAVQATSVATGFDCSDCAKHIPNTFLPPKNNYTQYLNGQPGGAGPSSPGDGVQ